MRSSSIVIFTNICLTKDKILLENLRLVAEKSGEKVRNACWT